MSIPDPFSHVPTGSYAAGSSFGTTPEDVVHAKGKQYEIPLNLGFDDDDDFDPKEMKKRMFLAEQNLMIKDAEIVQLKDQLTQKDQQIEQMQSDISMLFSLVYDLKAKLEKKFGQEFADPADVISPEEQKRRDQELRADREKGIADYFAGPEATPEEKQAKKRRYVVLKNRNKNPDHPDAHAEHILMDVGTSMFDKMGNRSGIISWGFETDRQRWWIKRNRGSMEWYKDEKAFQSFTKSDLEDLANAPYMSNESGSGCGQRFYARLKREARNGFPTMKFAKPFYEAVEGVYDKKTKRKMKILKWPATAKEKTVPLVEKIPEGALQDMLFWAYDSQMGNVEITYKNDVTYRLTDVMDLLKVSRSDLEMLKRHQLECLERDEPKAKQWNKAVASCLILTGDGPGSHKKFSKHGQRG
jgi:hypothetical protein